MYDVFLHNGKIRNLTKDDLRLVWEWRNSDFVRENMINQKIIGWEEHQIWFDSMDWNKNIYYIFEYKDEKLGLIYFNDICRKQKKCRWGFYLGKSSLPKGMGMLMAYISLENLFDYEELEIINSEVLEHNQRSINYHQKLGFKNSSLVTSEIPKEGIIDMSLTKKTWKNEKAAKIKNLFFRGEEVFDNIKEEFPNIYKEEGE